jgi:hypothetical protein
LTQEKLENTQLEQTEEIIVNGIDKRATEEENGFCENKPNGIIIGLL